MWGDFLAALTCFPRNVLKTSKGEYNVLYLSRFLSVSNGRGHLYPEIKNNFYLNTIELL